MSKPKVSIIVSCYHRPQALKKFLDTLKQQTFKDFDVWVMDEASHEDNKKVALTTSLPNVNYVKCDRFNDWGFTVKEKGFAMSKGSRVCFPADDAIYRPEFLRMLMLEDEDIVACDFNLNQMGRQEVAPIPCRIDVGGFLIKRKAFKGWKNKGGLGDGETIQDLVLGGATFKRVPLLLYDKN